MESTELVNTYLTAGAGGVCVILMVWVVTYLMRTIVPKLNKLESDQQVTNEILRNTNEMMKHSLEIISRNQEVIDGNQKALDNNTEAMKNFSVALQEFSGSINVQNDRLRDIEDCNHKMAIDIVKIAERVKK